MGWEEVVTTGTVCAELNWCEITGVVGELPGFPAYSKSSSSSSLSLLQELFIPREPFDLLRPLSRTVH